MRKAAAMRARPRRDLLRSFRPQLLPVEISMHRKKASLILGSLINGEAVTDKWGSGDLIEVPFDVEDDYNEWFQLFEDDSFAMGLKGLYGCTSVIIASERGALLVSSAPPMLKTIGIITKFPSASGHAKDRARLIQF